MHRILVMILVVIGLQSAGCQTFSGGSSGFADDTEFRAWFAYYYKDPRPDELRLAVDYMESHRYLEEYPDIASIFIAHVMRAHPERLDAWNAEFASLQPKTWNVLVISYWLVDTAEGRRLAHLGVEHADAASREQLGAMLTKSPAELDLLTFEAREPRHINLLWAAFSATGDTRYVERVISYVHLYGNEERPDVASLGEAAIMTLATNSLQHDRVAKASDEAQQHHPDPRTRALLGAMITALAKIAAEDQGTPAH